MRIVIEIDGFESHASADTEERAAVQHEPESVDGGSGPGGDGPSSSAGLEMDSGGPPQSLLDEIAAAEAAGNQGASDEAGNTDAGAGPSGQ